jgi:toluene monooxygenase electron transfer component
MPRIELAGREASFTCDSDDTIMRAAVRAGLGFPYECNIGSCGTCRFELLEGAVEHVRLDPPGYTERDRQRKRWLGCQARPLGDCKIKVNLNQRFGSLYLPRRVTARLLSLTKETHDISEFRFGLDEHVRFLPGQYALLSIPGVEGARAYSMCNVDDGQPRLDFQIRRVPNGTATFALFERLTVGDTIDIDGPYGTAYLREDAPRDIICLAGGSGLSPMISIARGAAASKRFTDRKIHFVYGGRTPRDIAGEALLAQLPGWGERVFYYSSISISDDVASADWDGRTGLLHEVAVRIFGKDLPNHEIYFAGPPAMAAAVQKTLYDFNVPPAQVHFDQFF